MIRRHATYLTFVSAALLSFSSATMSQELQCDVIVHTEALSTSVVDLLRDFESDVERYLNGTKYTDEDMLGDRISCSFEIYFQSGSGENRYTAQVFVGSQRRVYVNDEPSERTSPIMRIMDEKWEFTYLPGQRMRHDEFSTDALTDFLDFYAYLIIGMDLETYEAGTGDPSFRKAMNLCIQAQSSAVSGREYEFVAGKYSRYGLTEELNNNKYAAIREAITAYHFEGIDRLTTNELDALAAMLKAIETIDRVRQIQNPISVLVKQFFNVKSREIADAFQNYPDPRVYDKLGEYDPEHLSIYRERTPR